MSESNSYTPSEGTGTVTASLRAPIIQDPNGGGLKAPEEILPSYSALRYVYQALRQEHVFRIDIYAQIQGLIAGNPPYDPLELEQNGLEHIANFNPLDARATTDKAALALWNLTNQTKNLLKIEFYSDDPEAIRQADIIAEEWSLVVRNWPPFYSKMNVLAKQLIDIGLSPIVWTDEKDWRWDTVQMSQCYLPDESQSDIEKLTTVCIETTYTIQYLWNVYNSLRHLQGEARKPTKDQPWDIEALEIYLLQRANSFAVANFGGQFGPFLNIQQLQTQIQNNDAAFYNQYSFDSVTLVSVFYQEYSKKISRYMFDRDYSIERCLYKAIGQYEKFDDALLIYTASPGEYTYHSNRGIGHKILSNYTAIMQNDCAAFDMSKWSSTVMIQSPATGAHDAEAIRFVQGSVTNIGSATIQQNALGVNIPQVVSVSQYLKAKTENNLANAGDDPSIPDKSEGSKSAPEAQSKLLKEFGVLRHVVAHWYNKTDLLFRSMFVKMLQSTDKDPGYEYAKAFRKNCERRGIKPELLKATPLDYRGIPEQFRDISAVRVAGDGSTLARITNLNLLLPLVGEFGPRERREYKREWIEATVGSEYEKVFMQDSDNADEAAGGVSLATVENSMMEDGRMPFASADNEQKSHIVTHLALGNDVVRRVGSKQLSPIDADKIYNVLVPHLKEHLQFAAQSPFNKDFVEAVKKPIDELERQANFNRRNAAQMYQAEIAKRQKAEAQLSAEELEQQRKDMVAERTEARNDYKVGKQVERADRANEVRGENMREATREKAQNERIKIALNSENRKAEIAAQSTEQITSELAKLNGNTLAPYDIETP